ncbi:type II toxin-antitoxin system Phd/YefM family antitoxin [Asticcacaulis sp. AC402]|uniref:type II toxin-antitoxin system Phd/YefM family antitoxin n=1 Tax=Asticcacaulis sp. AC402 TaxID=1282361 RepID=UPI0003C3F27E|nr:type II toxin-antitoxin system prevent-host-death family antitoxin [Asticcacaulis sp. AC402]ESQ77146.1 hypothetical protein ABAC402_01740 [Asticcacaulis sp. AC402]
MYISVSDAKAQLTDLVRRAEAGDEVVLTRHGHAAVRLVPVKPKLSPEEKSRIIRELRESARRNAIPAPDAAHAADDLYDEFGLPK